MMLLRRYWQLALCVLLAGALVVSCHARDNALRAEGAMREQLKALTAKTHRDSVLERNAATVVQHDTIVLTKWLVRYDTVRHTLNIHDTVAVVTYIAVADSTIHACREAVGSLTTLCARKDTIIADLRAKLGVVTVQPSAAKSQRVLWFLGGLAAGAVVERVVH